MKEAGKDAFEKMAAGGLSDIASLTSDLRRGLTDSGLRTLAAAAVHVAAAAPERMTETYDAAAAGWLGREISPPGARALEPLTVSRGWWSSFWNVATPATRVQRRYAQQMMELAGELDPGINLRMASAALEFPGVAEAAKMGNSPPYEIDRLSLFSPASLGFALSEELLRAGSPVFDPYWSGVLPYLKHMPAPLNYVNVEVIQAMPLWALVAGYTSRGLDRVGFGGFLMGQLGHHYSALASAVTLTTAAMTRPEGADVLLDCLLKGWAHGRATLPLTLIAWEPLWNSRVDQVRETLKIRPFDSPYATPQRQGWVPRVV